MHQPSTYDIAIVGGGLAGLSLAIQAATAGYSVILFEKEQYPFHKVCGEYISMESYDFLQQLGVDIPGKHLPEIHKLQVTSVSGAAYNFALPLGGFGISRYSLDYELYKIAVKRGVVIKEHCKVQDVVFTNDAFAVNANGELYTATVAAGCYGKRSNLDIKWKRSFTTKKAGCKNYVGIKYHIRYPHDAGQIVLHNFAQGYCGMSKIEDDKSCLCYLATAAQLQAAGNSMKALEQNVLCRNPHLKKIFSTATFLYDEPLAISQISFAPKAAVENHMLMVGDAAGLITPLCGNGMSMAMHASKICFQALQPFLQKKISREEMETRYQHNWKRQFATRLHMGRILQNFFGEPRSTRLFLQLMNAIPPLSTTLIRSTHGSAF